MNNSNTSYRVNDTTVIPAIFQTAPQEERWIQTLNLFLAIMEIIIAATALAGNLLVVYAFIAYKKLRTSVTNYFVISLAVSDILTSGVVTLFKADSTLKDQEWMHGEFMCSLYTTMYLLALPSSVVNLCAVTVDRFLVLRMPLRYNSLMPPNRAVFIICCLWIYALVWACLPAMGWKNNLPILQHGYCYFPTTRGYNVTVNIINFLLPMIFMATFWFFIYTIVIRHRERVFEIERNLSFNTNETNESSHNSCNTLSSYAASSSHLAPKEKPERKKMRRNVRRSRYIGFIVVLFYFCWLPYVTLSMIGNLCGWCHQQHLIPYVLYDALLALGLMNSALNPFLYPFHDKHFKEAFRDMWKKMASKTFVKLLSQREKVLEMARVEVSVVNGRSWLKQITMAVFILKTHYPSGRTWANICSSSGYASLV